RPLVSTEMINRCFEEAGIHGTAIPAVTIPDSIRSLAAGTTRAEDRSRYIAVQTPQCFRAEYIAKAYTGTGRPEFTDDASVLEAAGIQLRFTEGERWNIKITFPEDLKVAEALLQQ
ncbi:MAG: 2-C-methyl-D-erythritol 4-phosphate cytidylyltransferase, partial [Flavobacteriales bacterium]